LPSIRISYLHQYIIHQEEEEIDDDVEEVKERKRIHGPQLPGIFLKNSITSASFPKKE